MFNKSGQFFNSFLQRSRFWHCLFLKCPLMSRATMLIFWRKKNSLAKWYHYNLNLACVNFKIKDTNSWTYRSQILFLAKVHFWAISSVYSFNSSKKSQMVVTWSWSTINKCDIVSEVYCIYTMLQSNSKFTTWHFGIYCHPVYSKITTWHFWQCFCLSFEI